MGSAGLARRSGTPQWALLALLVATATARIDAFQHAFSTSGSGQGVETRWSTLRPWLPHPGEETTASSKSPVIGWTLEERDDLFQSHKVTVGWGMPPARQNDPLEGAAAAAAATTVDLPYFPPDETALGGNQWPSGLATAVLLQSPAVQRRLRQAPARAAADGGNPREVLELGSGLGLPGLLVAKQHPAPCRVTLTDHEDRIVRELARVARERALDNSADGDPTAAAVARVLDWLEVAAHHPGDTDDPLVPPPAGLVLGSDIAYKASLVQPLADTIRAVLDRDAEDATVFVGGQADRKSFWDLFETLGGCAAAREESNESGGLWPGSTQMLLYRLRMGDWRSQENDDQAASEDEGRFVPPNPDDDDDDQRFDDTPVGLLRYQPRGRLSPLTEFDYVASLNDKEGMALTF